MASSHLNIRDARKATWAMFALLLAGLVLVSAIGWFFQRLIDDIDRQLTNERVHLFIGDQLVLNVQHSELMVYKLAPAGKTEIYEKLLKKLDATADQMNEYMQIMQVGGVARDSTAMEMSNPVIPGRGLKYTASPNPKMKLMAGEIDAMTAQLKAIAREMISRLIERDRCFAEKLPCVVEATNRVREYFRELPPFFAKFNLQANEHRRQILANLEVLESDLVNRQATLRKLQLSFVFLVSMSLMAFALFFTRRINAAQTQLMEARRVAEAASVAKSNFLATVSHEIRTPMNGTLGMIHLLQDSALNSEQSELAQNAATSAESLLQIINDILDLSKIEAGKMQFDRQVFSVRAVAEAVITANRAVAHSKSIGLSLEVEPGAAGYFIGDVVRIRQVLLNLVGNALKFTEQGDVRLRVAMAGRHLRFEVRDTGIGIPSAARSKLFSTFSQVDTSTTRRFGGTGLGLAISKQLVEGMGGEIDFSSTPGQGSCFWFELPLQPALDDVAHTAGQRNGGPDSLELTLASEAKRSAQGACRVLLAEDNLINQKLAMTLLTRLGYEVDLVVNGFEALAAVQKHPYDAVLMDLQMPHMDGLEATQAIRALGGPFASLPIIAVTANAMQSDRQAALACGMTDFIAKPFVRGDLTDCLNRWVSARSSAS